MISSFANQLLYGFIQSWFVILLIGIIFGVYFLNLFINIIENIISLFL